ncbi:TIGR03943 family putative permease subunit [Actinomadura rugatobispora]|uniref:TIGR03943 family putative permease subunit n=1 Tax=Actinomadura rugatobispora TaxID=1994 RepID=A0ABW1AGY5_9ACTN|nr:TIGR03943 family protein [Actinomadura rugatobispora]
MTKAAQNLLLIAIGAAVLWITLATDEYLNYVKPWFRLPLVAAAAAMVVLGGAGLRREWREKPEDAHGHDHEDGHGHGHGHDHGGHDHGGRGPRVAWLMCLPVLAIFIVAPPALGSYTASRDTGRQAQPPPPPAAGFGELPRTGGPVPMTMGEFIGRSYEAQTGQSPYLRGVPVQLTGFVTPRPKGGGWQVTRLKMACCAGDAVPFPVVVHGLERPPADAWVRVVGTWRPPAGGEAVSGVHELQGQSVTRIKKPRNPYE